MVSLRETTSLLVPEAPQWAQRFAQRLDLRYQLIWPRQPARNWQTTKAGLPLASDWPGGQVVLTDLNKIAFSDGTIWRDAMGNAI